MYRLLRALLFLLPAETAHALGIALLRLLGALAPLRRLIARRRRVEDPALEVQAFGVRFPHPVGLAAGFDKEACVFEALGALGFAFVEVGTITPRAQPGNPRPRIFRLPADRALLNRMGFNNEGLEGAERRLRATHGERSTLVGVNVGKNKVTPEAEADADFAACARGLGPLADYLVVNVSSPNTPGLRDLQSVARLRPLLAAVRGALDAASPGRRVPLLVKIAPDLADEDIDAVADLALELGLDGIVATNTTISREGLRTPADEVAALGAGGVSGAPLKTRSLEVLRRLRRRVGSRLVLVSVGGIEDADDAWERICAGATLVQIYTSFIYGGPATAARIARGLGARLRAEGFSRLPDVIGSGERGAASSVR